MKADPSWRRQAIRGTSFTTAFAQVPVDHQTHCSAFAMHALLNSPRKIPNAVHSCQLYDQLNCPGRRESNKPEIYPMTRAPRTTAGLNSAAYIGTYAAVSIFGFSLMLGPRLTVAAFAPIPIPRTRRTANKVAQ